MAQTLKSNAFSKTTVESNNYFLAKIPGVPVGMFKVKNKQC